MTTETLSSCCQKVKEEITFSSACAIHFQKSKIEKLEKALAVAHKRNRSYAQKISRLQRENQ